MEKQIIFPRNISNYIFISIYSGSNKIALLKKNEINYIGKLILKNQIFKKFPREYLIRKHIDCKYFIQIIDMFEYNDYFILILPLAFGHHIYNPLPNYQYIKYLAIFFYKILKGLSNLHKNGFIHGDIRPENILILDSNLNHPTPLIIDLEFCSKSSLLNDEKCRCLLCTPRFASNEIINKKPHSFSSDIYSLGVTFYFFISKIILGNRINKSPSFKEEIWKFYPKSLKDLIIKMTHINQYKRLTSKQCLRHSFFNEILLNYILDTFI